ncbi:MAG: bifunctional (p)ppGpp synthetase/guanosine-3',5'-bis(diphosphate) 3'-pyrophosphohydrolase [Lachnospiraceae bacterium]|nr:bifunctional (p)ppGpp synthetase/guanosine-3',5'-bis(diphosphate) 3'-pyrophosphohydrolase [Lachnospiraceae bacterium]
MDDTDQKKDDNIENKRKSAKAHVESTMLDSEERDSARAKLLPAKDSFDDIPDDFTDPEILFQRLISVIRAYHPSDDLSMIEKAYALARSAHGDQKRKSGEPYISHPICVAIILAELEMDKETIMAGLLHDVIEDTPYTYKQIADMFGEEVAMLVDGVTKLTQLSWEQDKLEIQAENLRKMFLAMAKDIRVIIIKLADRLHNMRTLQYMKPEKQKEKARETMDIYAPIANRLGISRIKTELDDLSLRYLEPEKYAEIESSINLVKEDRERFVAEIISDVSAELEKSEIPAFLEGRVKHIFSIYKKMVNKNKTFDQIYDVFAVRIIVESVKDCYAALGVLHEMYKPIPGRFKDYIAMPKPNMYQSLHTTLISKTGQPFEIQIRTREMHRTAEYGIAAHWKYKESGSGEAALKSEEEKLNWLRQILEWQNDMSDNKEFLDVLKNDLDLFSDSVYCFTPTGDVITLPAGSTPVDFAYAIHTAVGNRMIGARVNNRIVNIDYQIQNGDRIEIVTSQNSKGPSRDWLKIVKSGQARSKINQWFRNQSRDDNIARGKDLIAAYCKSKAIVLSDIYKPELMNKVMAKYGFRDWDSVLAAVGHGGLSEGQVVGKLQEELRSKKRQALSDADVLAGTLPTGKNAQNQQLQVASSGQTAQQIAQQNQDASRGEGFDRKEAPSVYHHRKSGIVVNGADDVAVRFSRCCNPVPGDEIVGFITRGRGITIHRTDCINIMSLPENERVRLTPAEWSIESIAQTKGTYSAEIRIFAKNRVGLLVDITKILSERQIDITSINVRKNKQETATIMMTFDISSKEELRSICDKIRTVEGVYDIERAG